MNGGNARVNSEGSAGEAAVTTLAELSSSSSPPDVLQLMPTDRAARAWIDHLKRGGEMPERDNLIPLLEALVAGYVPPAMPTGNFDSSDATLTIVDTSMQNKFPHMLDTQNGRLNEVDYIWTQCKTKMTHFCVKLVDSAGNPVKGTAVQEGGLELQLTLHRVTDSAEPMTDDHNPRQTEGLFLGRASQPFNPVALMTESRHEFRFQVMLLSSDIAGDRMFVKATPTHPELALNPKLTVQSRSFISRARMPDESVDHNRAKNAARRAAASQLVTMAYHLVDSQGFSPPASVDTDPPAESPSKRHCPSPSCSY